MLDAAVGLFGNHPLRQQIRERLVDLHQSNIAQRFSEEASIKQYLALKLVIINNRSYISGFLSLNLDFLNHRGA